jgi:hypothetical protein
MLIGVSKGMMKWSPTWFALVRGHMALLGMRAVRVTLRWPPGDEYPRGSTVLALRRAEQAASGRRLVLAVYSKARHPPKIARGLQNRLEFGSFQITTSFTSGASSRSWTTKSQ